MRKAVQQSHRTGRVAAMRFAIILVRIPLWVASVATWHLEALRARLQTACDASRELTAHSFAVARNDAPAKRKSIPN